ncbi:helix-turn-helix domain-containing protein [Mycobacterium sp.]|uniref:helix-turn-helix domain-containing protein n=1 Tax=Mycobacterium sp. TaxID=1785 RepID=UPI003F9A9078
MTRKLSPTKYLTLGQVAEKLNISKRSVRQLIADKRLPAVALNSRLIRVAESDLADLLAPVVPD